MTTRRRFLGQATLAGAAGLVSAPLSLAQGKAFRAAKPMRMLFLGATGFLGPHYIRAAVDRGHKVSVFIYRPNADKDIAVLPAGVEPLLGDRNGDLRSVQDRDWDAVFDVATYGPLWVRTLGNALRGRVGHYTFISTLRTYRFPGASDESSPLESYTGDVDPYSDSLTTVGKYYGPLKVLCEQEAERQFPGKTLVVRLSYPVGPNERIGALTYWVARLQQGGEILVAGDPLIPVQLLDMRDLAEWSVRMAERGTSGIFNTAGPGPALPLRWGELLGAIRGTFSIPTKLTWVPVPWLSERKIGPLSAVLFFPTEFGTPGGWGLNNEKARANGLTFRPLNTTIADTLDWYNGLTPEAQVKALAPFDNEHKGLEQSMARERELLAEWHARPQKGA